MSRRSVRHRSREAKYWTGGSVADLPLAPVAEPPPPPSSRRARRVGIGNASPSPLPEPRDLAERVLVVFHERGTLWDGDPTHLGLSTGNVAAILGLRPETPERRALNGMLTDLREGGFLKFEFDPAYGREVRWWLLPRGAEAVAPVG